MATQVPANEAGRLEALRQYALLDTPPESAFDDLVTVASYVCKTPVAAISIVDVDRLWFKARHGLSMTESPRDNSFCAHAILGPETLVVPDATQDSRFADNCYVTGEPGIRFYAGAPMTNAQGFTLGAVCVIDTVPRQTLMEEQQYALEVLARQVLVQLELRRMTRAALATASTGSETLTVCAWCKTVSEGDGHWKSFEQFIKGRVDVRMNHGMCPHCFVSQSRELERPQ